MSGISIVSADDSINVTDSEIPAGENVGYVEQYADGSLKLDDGQTADDLINLSECSSIVLHVSDNEGVISVRRDSTDSADVIVESGNWGNIQYLKQYKDDGYGYFAHAIVTSNGWLIGNGGITDGSVFRQIESIASEMVVNNQITDSYLSRIYSILSGYSLGHFVIKSSDGTYGVVFNNLYHVSKLLPGQYVVCPNVYSMSQKSNFNTGANPVDESIRIDYSDAYGVNRRNVMTYHWKLTTSPNGLSYSVDSYASNDNGAGVGRSTASLSDNVYYFGQYYSRYSIPTTLDKLYLGTHVFDNTINVFQLLTPISSALVGENIELRYKVSYIPHSNPIVQFAIPQGFDLNSASVSKGNYVFTDGVVVWYLNDCDSDNYITLSLKAVKSGQFDLVYSLDNNFVNSNKLYANAYGAVISANNISKYYKGPEKLNVYLKDVENNPIVGEKIIVRINGVDYERTADDNGIASIAINLIPGDYNVDITYNGRFGQNATVANVKVFKTIEGNDIVKMFRNDTQYYAKFIDVSGNPLANADVQFNINGVFYTRQTNQNGEAKLNINLNPGEYILTAINPVNGDQYSNTVKVLSILVEGHDLTKYYRNATPYSIKVLDAVGNALANVDVEFNINGVFYTRATDSSGYSNLNINLLPGEYIITAMYNGLASSNNIKVLPVLFANDTVGNTNDSNFAAKLIDGQGAPYANQSIDFTIDDVVYSNVTDDNGIAKLSVNLEEGEYTVFSSYNELYIKNKLIIKDEVY
ncbi:Ig-like domain repeat protein [Methanobrevibacter sp.]|uniref:Ig-like domain repeat protein n=1 Tax=Methanobrevibacter sp. TaxID=66852 RepID=UPI00388EEA1B